MSRDLQNLFELAGFILRKWKSSEADVLASIPKDLRNPKTKQKINYQDEYTKVLGIKWNVVLDSFRPVISLFWVDTPLTKQVLMLNIACLYDI